MNPDLRRGRSGTLSVKATLVIVVGVYLFVERVFFPGGIV